MIKMKILKKADFKPSEGEKKFYRVEKWLALMFKVRQVFEVREDFKKKFYCGGRGLGVTFWQKKSFFGGGNVHFKKNQFLTKISTFLWENLNSELEFLIF